MNWADMLEWLQEQCVHVSVEVNEHRVYYETVEQSLAGRYQDLFDADEAELRAECVRKNELVVVQVYPDTPIGFYQVGNWHLGRAVRAAYEAVKKERSQQPGEEKEE